MSNWASMAASTPKHSPFGVKNGTAARRHSALAPAIPHRFGAARHGRLGGRGSSRNHQDVLERCEFDSTVPGYLSGKELMKGRKLGSGRSAVASAGVLPRTAWRRTTLDLLAARLCLPSFRTIWTSSWMIRFVRNWERHLGGCKPCQAFLASLKATIEECRSASAERPDREKAVALRAKLLADYERLAAKSKYS